VTDQAWLKARRPRQAEFLHCYILTEARISRADVAEFMVKEAENPSSIHKIIGICA